MGFRGGFLGFSGVSAPPWDPKSPPEPPWAPPHRHDLGLGDVGGDVPHEQRAGFVQGPGFGVRDPPRGRPWDPLLGFLGWGRGGRRGRGPGVVLRVAFVVLGLLWGGTRGEGQRGHPKTRQRSPLKNPGALRAPKAPRDPKTLPETPNLPKRPQTPHKDSKPPQRPQTLPIPSIPSLKTPKLPLRTPTPPTGDPKNPPDTPKAPQDLRDTPNPMRPRERPQCPLRDPPGPLTVLVLGSPRPPLAVPAVAVPVLAVPAALTRPRLRGAPAGVRGRGLRERGGARDKRAWLCERGQGLGERGVVCA